jgi:cell division protein ZapA
MPKIKLKIAGRPYEIACNLGDEERVLKLALRLDERASKVAKNLGQASENMILVVTALMMEDELGNDRHEDAAKPATAQETALQPLTKKMEALANSLEV